MKPPVLLGLILLICVARGSSPALAAGDCSDYTNLTGLELPIEVTGTTAGATGDYGPFVEEPSCWEGAWDASCAYSSDVTYKWTVPHDGLFTITLAESPTNADLLIYHFTCPAEPIYPDDFLCGSHRCFQGCATVADVPLMAGQEILIVVDGWLIWNGDFTLRIYDTTTHSDILAMGMDLQPAVGMTATSVWGGSGRWVDHLGLANISGESVGDDHLFPMEAVSALVTVTALMQLWEDDLFELDDAVDDYLPFPVRHPEYPEIPITFRMVMSHVASIQTSGIQELERDDGTDSPITPCELVEGYLVPGGQWFSDWSYIPGTPPGTQHLSSRINATLMACLVEHIDEGELTFEDYCREHIFDPLGMSSSSFLLANIDPDDLATNYYWDGQDQYVEYGHRTAPWYPAEYLRSNARELSRFMLAYINGGELYGERILEPATIETMFTEYYPDLITGLGLIWYTTQAGGIPGWGIWGTDTGTIAKFWLSRDQGVGALAVTNSHTMTSDALDATIDLLAFRALSDAESSTAAPDAGSAVPGLAHLEPCYPNPFNPRTSIRFEVPDAGHARLAIYDLRGRLIVTLLDEAVSAGSRTVIWDGRDGDGREVPSGAYLSRLEAEGQVAHGRMALVR